MIMRLEEEYEIWAMMDVRRVMKAHTLVFYCIEVTSKQRKEAQLHIGIMLDYHI